jgi:hypothetical protein
MLLQYTCSGAEAQYRQMAAIQLKNILKRVYGVKSDKESHYNQKNEGEQLAQDDPANLMDPNARQLLQDQLVDLMMGAQQ